MRRSLIIAWIMTVLLAAWPFGPTAAAPQCYPTNRFVVLTGGMVEDTLTRLVWQQDGSGPRAGCSGVDGLTCTWAEAKAYCAGLATSKFGGYSDWRLPTVKELRSIVDYRVAAPGPTIDQTAFPNTPAERFWTSSPRAGSSGDAWFVNFNDGRSNYDDVGNGSRVRCVR